MAMQPVDNGSTAVLVCYSPRVGTYITFPSPTKRQKEDM